MDESQPTKLVANDTSVVKIKETEQTHRLQMGNDSIFF